jgi:NAD(P)-dependent dehydrogenase (short-subunit alcohol dehydrogenase family)
MTPAGERETAQPFAGRAAIVTGAAGGIGRATAAALAARGAAVLVADRREEIEATAAELAAAGAEVVPWTVDVTSAEEVEAMIAAAVRRFGRLDVLVNNAGATGAPTPLADQEPAAFDKVFAVNVRGTFLGMKFAMPHLARDGGGAIVNVSSVTAVRPLPGLGAYSASKEAVVSLTRVAALEGAASGVRVNAVLPGPTATRMIGDQDFSGDVPLGRAAAPEEPAEAICFLASAAASFITGEALLVDGGMSWGGSAEEARRWHAG